MAMNVSWGALIDGGAANVTLNTPQNESGSVKTDASGNVYSIQYTQATGTIVIYNGDGTQHASFATSTTNTAMLIKRNSAGAVQWYVRIENGSWFTPTCLDVDSNGNVYTAGYYDGTGSFTFRSTNATTAQISKTYALFTAYLAKYNSSGVVQWAFRPFLYTANGPSTLQNLVIDSSNNVYIVGSAPGTGYTVTSYDIASADGSKWRTSIPRGATWQDAWLIKYNSSGIAQWGVRCATTLEARATAVALSPDGTSVLVAGVLHASGTYNVNRVDGTNDTSSTTVVATAGADGFIVSYTSAGQVNWAAAVTGAATDINANQAEFPVSLAVSATGVYFGMRTMSSTLVVKGTSVSGFAQYTGVVIKMNLSTGAYIWSTKIIPTSPGASSYAYLTSIALDSNENVYVGGLQTAATATITDTGNATKSLSRIGTAGDGMVVKFNSSGVYQSINRISNVNMSSWWKDSPEVAVDKDNNVVFNASTDGTGGRTVSVYNSNETTVGFSKAITGWVSMNVKFSAPATAPGAPTAVSAVAGNGQAVVSFTAPASNGGATITSYTVTSSPGGFTGTGSSSPITVTGLSNGTAYTFTVTATNSAGTSSASSASSSVTPVTVPGAPTAVSAVAGNGQAVVSFTAPASNGGATITSYTVTSSPGGFTGTGSSSPITVTGLSNGTAYTFTVTATNSAGTGSASSASSGVTPVTVPSQASAPTITSIADTSVTIGWSAPSNGGSAITGYTITIYNIDAATSTTASAAAGDTSKTFSGLTNGVTYKFAIYATNAQGNGTNSSQSAAAVPATIPSTPVAPTLSAIGNQTITVNWLAPLNGGSAITGYTITIYNITASTTSTTSAAAGATSKVIGGLTNASSYQFTVIATNAAGNSLESTKSVAGIPFTIPAVPTSVTATSGESLRALVSWTKPSNNGSAITSYTIKAITGGSTVSTRVVDGEDITSGYVYGLTNGTAYTFKVSATNAAGTSADSTASSAATPQSDAPTTAVVDAISSQATFTPAPIQNYIQNVVATTVEAKADLTIEMRTAIQAATVNATEEVKAEAKVTYIEAMRTKVGGDSYAVPSTKFEEFIKTLETTTTATIVPKPIEVFVPAYVPETKTATVDVSSVSSDKYIHVEVPPGYTVILQNAGQSISLLYNGTNFSHNGITYTAGSSIVLGTKTYTIIGFGSGSFEQGNTSEVICVVEGSQILTPSGNVAVEKLAKGDHVMTIDGRALPISKIYKIGVAGATAVNAPYIIEKDAFGVNCPPQQLEVSPRHAIMIKPDLWELPIEAAKENSRVYQNKAAIGKQVVYYHFALNNYESDHVYVNGQMTETMNDGHCLENYVWNIEKRGYTRTYTQLNKTNALKH